MQSAKKCNYLYTALLVKFETVCGKCHRANFSCLWSKARKLHRETTRKEGILAIERKYDQKWGRFTSRLQGIVGN